MDNRYITTKAAGEILGISVSAVVRLIQRGRLGASRMGMTYLIPRDSVVELSKSPLYLKRTRRRPTPAQLEDAGQITLASELEEEEGEQKDKGRFTNQYELSGNDKAGVN